MPDTNNGGRWKVVDPAAEIALIAGVDSRTNGNTRAVAQMAKVWKRHCNASLKSYQVEQLVAEFLPSYAFAERDYYWYDWFFRDFFAYLCGKAWHNIIVPGTGEVINLGGSWLSRAESARDQALLACAYEHADLVNPAGIEWQKIFGPKILINPLSGSV